MLDGIEGKYSMEVFAEGDTSATSLEPEVGAKLIVIDNPVQVIFS